MIYTKMKRYWFKSILWILLTAVLLAGYVSATTQTRVLAQEPTPGSSDVFVTVIYTEQINIRNGPGTVLYDIIGNMQPGETAKALGVSPGREWVQIVFPAGPGGVAWVHTSLISISSGNLQIIEPPPTVTPRVTATIDPTLAAAYVFEPTTTRLPTFTPPPPLKVPQFTAEPPAPKKESVVPMGVLVLSMGFLGGFGYIVSYLRRR